MGRFSCLLFFITSRHTPARSILLFIMPACAIIVPCYNEADRIKTDPFSTLVEQHKDVALFFVDDGSKDRTRVVLEQFQVKHPAQVQILKHETNKGKAAAVFTGVNAALNMGSFSHIGYLDADLSTLPADFYDMYQLQVQQGLDYIFGSRIRMQGHVIKRNAFRHIAGRIVATLIDSRFRLGIYDTQCGAKCFTSTLCNLVFKTEFKTSWLFDVEIFLRIRQLAPDAKGMEYALKRWENEKGSKISALSFARVWNEIRLLKKYYR